MKMKLYLSKKTVDVIIAHDCEIASAENDIEAEEMTAVIEELRQADRNRDEQGKLELSRKTFDFVIDALDWYAGAYWGERENDR
jgi:hypothetical protein